MSIGSRLQETVLSELTWKPSVNHAHIGVTANPGVVRLTGHVDWYKRLATALAMVAMLALPTMAHNLAYANGHHHSNDHGNDHAKDHHRSDDHRNGHARDHDRHNDDHGNG